MNILQMALDEALRGKGSLVLLVGEAGVGKTRLSEELANVALGKTLRVLWGRCWAGGEAPVFWPWVQILRALVEDSDLVGSHADLPIAVSESIRLMSGVAESAEPGQSLTPFNREGSSRFLVFDRFSEVLKRAAALCPLLVVVEDLHWADESSLVLLEFLMSSVPQLPVLIVASCRHAGMASAQPLSRTLGELGRHRSCQRVVVSRLDEGHIAELVALATERRGSRELARDIWGKTDGNPLFVMEFIRSVQGARRDAPIAPLLVPESLRNLVQRQTSELTSDAMEILNTASVIGQEFDVRILVSAAGLSMAAVLRCLDEARSVGVVSEVPNVLGAWKFSHQLVAETLRESLGTAVRSCVHEKVGIALENLSLGHTVPTAALLAYHFANAISSGENSKAVTYGVRAGDEALEAMAYDDAIAHYRLALGAISDGSDDHLLRCRVLTALGEAQGRTGDWLAARGCFREAAVIALDGGLHSELARAAIGFKGTIAATAPVDREAVQWLETAIAAIGEKDEPLRVCLLSTLATSLYFEKSSERRDVLVDDALETARRLRNPVVLGVALEAELCSVLRPSGLDKVLRLAGELVRLARESGDREGGFRAHLFSHAALLEKGKTAASEQELVRCLQGERQLRHPRYAWQLALVIAARAMLRGDLSQSQKLSEEARRLGVRVHEASAEGYFLIQSFLLSRLRGTQAGFYECLIALDDVYAEIPVVLAGRASVSATLGRSDEARDALVCVAKNGFGDVADDAFALLVLTVLSEVCWVLDDQERMLQVYDRLSPYETHNIVVSWGAACDGSVAHYLGNLATKLGRWDAAGRHFERSLMANRKLGSPPLVARTQHLFAEMLWSRNLNGDRERARGLVAEAAATYRRFGIGGYLRQLLAGQCWRDGLQADGDGEEHQRAKQGPARGAESGEKSERNAARTARRGGEDPVARTPSRSTEGVSIFQREGEYWTIVFRGVVSRLRSTVGLEYLAYLVSRPHQEVPAIDLVSAVGRRGTMGYASHGGDVRLVDDQLRVAGLGDAGPIFDRRARDAYRGRMKDLRLQMEEAEEMNDVGRASALRREIEEIREEVAAGCGLGGRSRVAAAAFERARINVRNSISNALRAIGNYDRALWRHLTNSVRTGALCCYDPEDEVPWIVST